MKRYYLVRHAQTAWNKENRLQGQTDNPLDVIGLQQAAQLGERFASYRLTRVITSGLLRARQTAEKIVSANGHQITPIIDSTWQEMHLGIWEGLRAIDVEQKFPGVYQQWKNKPSSVQIPEGEVSEAFQNRVRSAWNRITDMPLDGGECVIVTHGGVIAALLAHLLQADYDVFLCRLRLDNAGVTVVEIGGKYPHVIEVNSVFHLPTLSPNPQDLDTSITSDNSNSKSNAD